MNRHPALIVLPVDEHAGHQFHTKPANMYQRPDKHQKWNGLHTSDVNGSSIQAFSLETKTGDFKVAYPASLQI